MNRLLFALALLLSSIAQAQVTINISLNVFGLCDAQDVPMKLGKQDTGWYIRTVASDQSTACHRLYRWSEQWTAAPESGGTFVATLSRPDPVVTNPAPGPSTLRVKMQMYVLGPCVGAGAPRLMTKQATGGYLINAPTFVASCWRIWEHMENWTKAPEDGGLFVSVEGSVMPRQL